MQTEILSLRKDCYNLAGKAVQELKEKNTALTLEIGELKHKYWVAVTIAGAAVALLGAIGITKLDELNKSHEARLNQRVDDSMTFFDNLAAGTVAASDQNCDEAVPRLRQGFQIRPHPLILAPLLRCYADRAELARRPRRLKE